MQLMRRAADTKRVGKQTRNWALAGLAMLLSLSAAACQPGDETRLELTVRADAELQLDEVAITVTGGQRKPLTRRFPVQHARAGAATAPDITWEVTVSNLTSPLVATLEVQGKAGGNAVVTLITEANLLPRQQIDALLRLTNSCRSSAVICAASAQTCVDGVCGPHPVFGPAIDAGIPVVPGMDAAPDVGADVATVADLGAIDRAPADAADARDVSVSVPDGGDAGRGPATNGTTCTGGFDCTSGNCVEGVCCDKPCGDACYSCRQALTSSSPNGTCAVIASGKDDPQGRCGAPAVASTCGNTSHCDGKGACDKYGGTTLCAPAACGATGTFTPAATCDGKGVCTPAQTQDCKGFACTTAGGCATTCATDADCTSGYCSPAKTCAAKKIDGSPCTANNNECAHGHCVGSICCESVCDGLCVSCSTTETNAASGLCKPIIGGGSSKTKCAVETTPCGHDGTCDGNGACRNRLPTTLCGSPVCSNGQLQDAPLCNGAGACGTAATKACIGSVACASATACKGTTCATDADCVGTHYCAAATMACTPKVGNGGPCLGNNQCALNNCVGSICCESACTATCSSCAMVDTTAADGLCRPIKAGGGSKGKCAVSTTLPCGNDGSCDGKGACAPAKAGVICGNPVCSNATFRAAPSCDGATNCIMPTTTTPCPGGVVCGSPMACGSTTCVRDTDCAAGNYCALSGASGTCVPTKSNGSTCTLGNECSLANCVAGICCESACTATCNSCAAVDTNQANGLCRPIKAGGSSKGKCILGAAPCGLDGTCDGNGNCHFPPANTTCGDPVCSGSSLRPQRTCNGAGTCGTPATGPCPGGVLCASATTCKPAACAVDGDCVSNFCSSTTCTARKNNGQACGADNECVSNMCADGVCCNTLCRGSCEYCNVSLALAGTCTPVTGTARTGHIACTGTDPCGATCRGASSACVPAPATTSCRAATCPVGTSTLTNPANCDGMGACSPVSTTSCNAFLCGGNACPTTCTSNTACVTGAACVNNACRACTGVSVCPNACVNLTSDANNCGTCGHSCLSGACISGVCQPVAIVTGLVGVPGALQLNGTNLFWNEADTFQAFVVNTSTLVKRSLFSSQRLPYRADGDLIISKFGSSLTTFNTCTLSGTCPTMTPFGPMLTTGGDFQLDPTTHRLFYTDFSFTDTVQVTPSSSFIVTSFLTLPVGFSSLGLVNVLGGFLYGVAAPLAGGPGVFWRASTASASTTASFLSTQIPTGGFALPQVGVTSNKIFFFTSTSVILSFPLNGSGNAVPTTYFNPGAPGGFVVDESFVYWTDFAIGNVYRCPVAACTSPDTIASGQTSNQNLVQDARALYWQLAGQQTGLHQIMRLAK